MTARNSGAPQGLKVWPGVAEICRVLRAYRYERGVTQSDLAVTIGVSRTTIGYWERGFNFPTEFNLECWKQALGYES